MGLVALIELDEAACVAVEHGAPEHRFVRCTASSFEREIGQRAVELAAILISARLEDRTGLVERSSRFAPTASVVLLGGGVGPAEAMQLLAAAEVARAPRAVTDGERAARAEQALWDAEQRSKLLIDAVTDYAIFTLDTDGIVTSWNPGAQRLKGYRSAEIIGRHFSRFYPEEEASSGKCEWELETAAKEGRFQEEGWRVRADGSRFFANVTITPIRDASGKLLGFAKVSRDLTEPLAAEAQRSRLAAENAALIERARTQEFQERFLAILGHDLRNPLAAIDMGASLLRATADGRGLKILDRVGASVLRMSRMIEQILDLTRSRLGGGLEIHRADVDLAGVLQEVVEELRAAHPTRQIVLQCPSPLVGRLDRDRLLQVFSNIIGNAISHGLPSSQIFIEARSLAGGAEGASAIVSVHNDGPSIPEELRRKLFDPFRRGDRESRTAQTAGLGLGLFISHQIVTGHGGAIEIVSSRQEGTTFRIILPLSAQRSEGDS